MAFGPAWYSGSSSASGLVTCSSSESSCDPCVFSAAVRLKKALYQPHEQILQP